MIGLIIFRIKGSRRLSMINGVVGSLANFQDLGGSWPMLGHKVFQGMELPRKIWILDNRSTILYRLPSSKSTSGCELSWTELVNQPARHVHLFVSVVAKLQLFRYPQQIAIRISAVFCDKSRFLLFSATFLNVHSLKTPKVDKLLKIFTELQVSQTK